jgi:NTE family protein
VIAEGSAGAIPAVTASPNTRLEVELGTGEPEEFGLALSGGGNRATLFHLGAILRINEMGHLREIDRIAGVSGGAVAAGLLARVWDDLHWDETGHATDLKKRLVPLVMRLAGMPLDIPIVLLGLIPFVSPARLMAWVLDTFFLHGLRLDQLPQVKGRRPRFVFNASDLGTGTLFRFEEPYMGTYQVGLVRHPKVKVAVAVAACAAFPPFFAPLNLDMDPDSVIDPGGATLHGRRELRKRAALFDGGAYDNLALEPITDRCHQYLVSDAGGNLKVQPPTWKWSFWTPLVLRTIDIAVSQDRALRGSALFLTRAAHPFALWRTLTDPTTGKVTTPFPIHEGWPAYLSTRSTRMWPFSPDDRKRLVNWGYITADVRLRRRTWTSAEPPEVLPFPEAAFAVAPPAAPDAVADPD